MKTTYRELKVGSHDLKLGWDDSGSPVVVDGKHEIGYLDELVKKIPELTNPSYVESFAIIANFLFSGYDYEVIEDLEHFANHYRRRLQEDPSLAEYGVFDIDVIQKPSVSDHNAIFYVEQLSTGVPFRVSCPFPYVNRSRPFAYTPLPYC